MATTETASNKTAPASVKARAAAFVVFLTTFVGVNVAVTQTIAKHFAYSEALGKPLVGHLYQPLAWLFWQREFREQAPKLFQIGAVVQLAVILVLIAMMFFLRPKRRPTAIADLHGSAHWASEDEISRMGLLEGQGVYVGGWEQT